MAAFELNVPAPTPRLQQHQRREQECEFGQGRNSPRCP